MVCPACNSASAVTQYDERCTHTWHTKPPRVPCPKCDLKFANEYMLKLHRQVSCCGIRHDDNRISDEELQRIAGLGNAEMKGRDEQREIDAKIAESYYFGSSRDNGTPFEIAEAIRSQNEKSK